MTEEFREPGALVLNVFDNLINRIKSTRPVGTDGRELTTGFVYSQMVLGMPIDPKDYLNPWSPMGGVTLQESVQAMQPVPAGGGAQPAPADASGSPAPDMSDFQRAMEAAFKISELLDRMIMVTDDDAFLEYPGAGRHISFAYEAVINGMQSKPMPEVSPEVQQQIDDAQKVLYELDEDGDIIGKSKRYKNYLANAAAYALAKMEYTDAQNAALADPVQAATWPMKAVFYQQKVDEAWDTLKTEGAEKVERALDILKSVGISMQDHMIAKARSLYDVWNLGLAGVPTTIPYAYVTPRNWCDPDDDDGFEQLSVTSSEYKSHSEFHSWNLAQGQFQSDSSSNSGAGGLSIFGFGGYGSGGSSSASWSNSFQAENGTRYQFHNDAKNLSISLKYAIATINRPYLVGDLFYLRDWYLVGNPADSVSDGTIQGQVRSEKPLLPMIPEQFLVIRDVTIEASESDWGGDGQTLKQMYADSQAEGSSWNAGGGAGFSIGYLTIGGTGSHSEAHTSSSFNSRSTTDSESNFGWSFNGQKLEIKGSQIIAFLSDIVPACPPEADPGL